MLLINFIAFITQPFFILTLLNGEIMSPLAIANFSIWYQLPAVAPIIHLFDITFTNDWW
ncbi:MAG: hypothetical protein ACJA2G_003589 [Cognaticolwellia sp.]|jgi:hypothetical protein